MVAPIDAKETLRKVKRLLDESNQIVEQIDSLKTEKNELRPLCGSLRRRSIRCGKDNCQCKRGRLHGPYHYFEPSKFRGKWQYVSKDDLESVERGIADWKKQLDIDERIKTLSERLDEIRREMTALIPQY
ncbi:MAG: hypothetical protein LUP95_04480 [Euryarchaeota archaeon]|nr:hypothetical protein [Euryarchaeota archaeon]